MRNQAADLMIRRPMRGLVRRLGADRRGGVLLESAIMLGVGIVSAMQVGALMGSTLQQSFAPVIAAVTALNGG